MSKLSIFSNTMRAPVLAIGVLGVSLLLTGCPTASNPTQPQSPSTAGPPPAGAGGMPGSSAGGGAGTSSGGAPGAGSAAGLPEGSPGGSGDSPVGSIDDAPDGSPSGSGPEPGFGDDVAATPGLPDLRDTQPAGGDASPGAGDQSGVTGGNPAGANSATTGSGQAGEYGSGGTAGDGATGKTTGGPLTPAERVAVLDDELARSTGEFDALIVKTQAEQREAARSEVPAATDPAVAPGGNEGRGAVFEGGLAETGGYSTGGGLGGSAGGGLPTNSAKYPPPKDIPSGNDDDVVARQLREAAMREPDPAVRERLWDEYRKYKGITP